MATAIADFPQTAGRILSARLAPSYELDGIDPPIASFGLVDESMGSSQLPAQFSLGEPGVDTPLAEQLTKSPIRWIVLRPCSHDGNTLSYDQIVPSLGTRPRAPKVGQMVDNDLMRRLVTGAITFTELSLLLVDKQSLEKSERKMKAYYAWCFGAVDSAAQGNGLSTTERYAVILEFFCQKFDLPTVEAEHIMEEVRSGYNDPAWYGVVQAGGQALMSWAAKDDDVAPTRFLFALQSIEPSNEGTEHGSGTVDSNEKGYPAATPSKEQQRQEEARKLQDADGHVWLPYKRHYDWQVEVCWRCKCLKIHMGRGRIKYKSSMFHLTGKDRPPSPCRKHRKSECPI